MLRTSKKMFSTVLVVVREVTHYMNHYSEIRHIGC